MKKDIKPKELKRVAKKPAAGEVKKNVPIGQSEGAVVRDLLKYPGQLEDLKTLETAKSEMRLAKHLDKNRGTEHGAEDQRRIDNNFSYQGPLRSDVYPAELKYQSKKIAKQAAKELKKKGAK